MCACRDAVNQGSLRLLLSCCCCMHSCSIPCWCSCCLRICCCCGSGLLFCLCCCYCCLCESRGAATCTAHVTHTLISHVCVCWAGASQPHSTVQCHVIPLHSRHECIQPLYVPQCVPWFIVNQQHLAVPPPPHPVGEEVYVCLLKASGPPSQHTDQTATRCVPIASC